MARHKAAGLELVERRLRAARLRVSGMTESEIAHKLDVSRSTVRDDLEIVLRDRSWQAVLEAPRRARRRVEEARQDGARPLGRMGWPGRSAAGTGLLYGRLDQVHAAARCACSTSTSRCRPSSRPMIATGCGAT